MKLLRFISKNEMNILLSDKVVEKIYTITGNSSLKEQKIMYFLDLDMADKYMIDSNAFPFEGETDTEQKILFYDLLLSGTVSNDFAVIIEKPSSDVKFGYGIYAHPGYFYDSPGINIDDDIYIKEVGVSSYSLDDIIEIWQHLGNNSFEKIE